jgi:hypothetical protein
MVTAGLNHYHYMNIFRMKKKHYYYLNQRNRITSTMKNRNESLLIYSEEIYIYVVVFFKAK